MKIILTKEDNDRLADILAEILEILTGLMDGTQASSREVAERAKSLKEEFRGIKRRGRSSSSSSSSEGKPSSSERGVGSFSGASGGVAVAKSISIESAEALYHADLARRFLDQAAESPANFSRLFSKSQEHQAIANRLSKYEEAKSHREDVRALVNSALAMRKEDLGLSGPAADAKRRRKGAA